MVPTPDATTDLPWRKRHPVVSRLLLYVLGLGLVGVLLVLFLERRESDERARADALAQELDGLGVVHLLDPDGSNVLKLLDEKFSDPGLPEKVRGRALRWRALALRKRSDPQAVEAVLREAAALDLASNERLALELEWAEARIAAGDADGALEILPGPRSVGGQPILALLRGLLFAQARQVSGKPGAGLADLREVVASLEAPLDPDVSHYVGGRDWKAGQVATLVSEVLAKNGGSAREPKVWRRLHRLAPHDFDAQLACTRGFLSLGLEDEARAAWTLARGIDAREAAAQARTDPRLAALAH